MSEHTPVPPGDARPASNVRLVTILREPLARIASLYNMIVLEHGGNDTSRTAAEYEADLAIIARIQRDLTEFVGPRGVAVVDLLVPFMDSEVRPYGEVDQSHPSVHGYGIAASAVLETLAASDLLDE